MKVRRAFMMSAASLLIAAACTSTQRSGDCPPPRQPNNICPEVVGWAKDPQTGTCCQYGRQCDAPEGWKVYNSEEECRAGS
jgi:hypothetical protein